MYTCTYYVQLYNEMFNILHSHENIHWLRTMTVVICNSFELDVVRVDGPHFRHNREILCLVRSIDIFVSVGPHFRHLWALIGVAILNCAH